MGWFDRYCITLKALPIFPVTSCRRHTDRANPPPPNFLSSHPRWYTAYIEFSPASTWAISFTLSLRESKDTDLSATYSLPENFLCTLKSAENLLKPFLSFCWHLFHLFLPLVLGHYPQRLYYTIINCRDVPIWLRGITPGRPFIWNFCNVLTFSVVGSLTAQKKPAKWWELKSNTAVEIFKYFYVKFTMWTIRKHAVKPS